MERHSSVGEDQNVKEEESARDDFPFAKGLLCSITTLLCNVFDARGGAVMVMVKLMQSSEVSSRTQRKLAGILDDIFTGSRLCNTAFVKGSRQAPYASMLKCILEG